MSNRYYPTFLDTLSQAGINFLTDDIRACLVTANYTPAASDHFLAAIAAVSGGILSRSGSITGKSVSSGVWNCSNIIFPLPASGFVGKWMVLFKWTGSDATSPNILVDDTGNNFPVTTDGANITFQVSTGPNKLCSLAAAGSVVT